MRVLGTSRSSYGRPFSEGAGRKAMRVGLLLAAALLAACAAPPPPPKPIVTPVSLTLAAGADMNPDVRGRASPLTVRVYALKSSSPFEAADFFSLYDKDQATLGGELVLREERLLRPGESQKIEMTLQADTKAIGVLAAYRDLDRARWREVRAVEPGKPLTLTLGFGARQISIESK